jgi:hypothetical protein
MRPLKILESRLALAGGIMLLASAGTAGAAENLKLRCINPASGTAWGIVVDLNHRRVDDAAAEISDRTIAWRDRENRIYELDRPTGALRMRNASSTGGYFLYYTCKPE